MKKTASSNDFPDCFYRVAVKGLCVRDGRVLLCHDFTGSYKALGGRWELPGGGMEFGDNFHETLRKEVREEMGLAVTWIADKPLYMWILKRGPMRGLDWHYVLIMAFPFEVKNLDLMPSEECRNIKFFSKDDLQSEPALSDQTLPLVELIDPKDFVRGSPRI